MPSLSSWLYLAIYLLALVDALFAISGAGMAAAAAVILFIAREAWATPRPQLLVGSALALGGVAIGLWAGVAEQVLLKGLTQTLPFLVIFGAVAWLQVPAGESPALRAARDTVLSQPPGWRFLMLALAAHGLGAVFNIAGMSLLAVMIAQQKDRILKRRLERALVQGFGAATTWSPLFVGSAVILAVLPSVRWLEIAPFGLVLGALLLALAWAVDRVTNPAGPAPMSAHARVPFPGWAAARITVIVGVLFVLVIGAVEMFRLSIPIAIGLIAPPFALIWQATRAANLGAVGTIMGGLAGRVVRSHEHLRGEAIMFAAANLFGAGINAAVAPDDVIRMLAALGLGPDGKIVLLVAIMVLGGAAGLHPVIPVVLVGHVLPPEALGLSAPVMAVALMALWGLCTNISPFSATTLFMARITRESHFTIAWRWNGPVSLMGGVVVAALIVLLRRLIGG